jgi:hypothetical protein
MDMETNDGHAAAGSTDGAAGSQGAIEGTQVSGAGIATGELAVSQPNAPLGTTDGVVQGESSATASFGSVAAEATNQGSASAPAPTFAPPPSELLYPAPPATAVVVAPLPTVSRRVWYWSDEDDPGEILNRRMPFDAGIIFVHGDGRVNLDVCCHTGHHFHKHGVALVQPGAVAAHHGHGIAQWMPVQTRPEYQQKGGV